MAPHSINADDEVRGEDCKKELDKAPHIAADDKVDDEDHEKETDNDMLCRTGLIVMGMPNAAPKCSGALHVFVGEAENVPVADFWSKSCDPYVQMRLLDGLEAESLDTASPLTREVRDVHLAKDSQAIQRTKIKNRSLNPVWEENFEFLVEDRASSVLYVELIDYDCGTKDDKLAFCYVWLATLKHGEQKDVTLKLVSRDPRKYNVEDTALHMRMRFVGW